MTDKQLPEAPASINFKVVDKEGFNYQITLRDFSENKLMGRVKAIRTWLVEQDFVAPGKQPAGNGSQNTPVPDLPNEDPGWCGIHDVKMFENSNERGTWWSHKTDDPAYHTGFCKGSGK